MDHTLANSRRRPAGGVLVVSEVGHGTTAVLDHNLTLKSDELYLVGNIDTDGSRERATGLYVRDTRHLSRFLVAINGRHPERLQVRVDDASHAMVLSGNPLLTLEDGGLLLPQKLLLEARVFLDDSLTIEVVVRNYSHRQLELTYSIEICADFRDLFDIRGYPRPARGTWTAPQKSNRSVVLGYLALDGLIEQTEVRFDQDAAFSESTIDVRSGDLVPRLPSMSGLVRLPELNDLPIVTARFPIGLEAGGSWSLSAVVTPLPAGGPAIAAPTFHQSRSSCRFITDDARLNRVLERCLSDLDALQTTFPHGSMPAAGIPWFVAPFGRDSLITSLQTLHLAPERAAGTLRVLGTLQGEEIDPLREEEPGKILHEMRYGEMARLGEIPHTPYYGTVDATPLFAWLVAETCIWTGDSGLYQELKPNAVRAVEWIEQYGDLDGDGLVEYRLDATGTGRITNQVWKDSQDSLNHPDGSIVSGPVAAIEVQGYAYAAYARMSVAAEAFGDPEWAGELFLRAEQIREQVEKSFWVDDIGFYAQALDGAKRPVATLSSNPGHLFLAGLPSPERAGMVIERMSLPDFNSGWGVRTLWTGAATYNPMSYHNGSVWPHDNSLVASGFYRYGHADAGHRVLRSLTDAALTDPLFRLPELFCGFQREGLPDETPVRYPVSCSPQAWAAGSLPLLLRHSLGLQVDPTTRTLLVEPNLPDWLSSVAIDGLSVLGARGSLIVLRLGDEYRVEAENLPLAATVDIH
jgi:glycogen debranching enzyme